MDGVHERLLAGRVQVVGPPAEARLDHRLPELRERPGGVDDGITGTDGRVQGRRGRHVHGTGRLETRRFRHGGEPLAVPCRQDHGRAGRPVGPGQRPGDQPAGVARSPDHDDRRLPRHWIPPQATCQTG